MIRIFFLTFIIYAYYKHLWILTLHVEYILSEDVMTVKNIKKTMIDQDLNVTKLAKITGYTRGHLSNVINGHFDSIRAKKSISLALRKDFDELWADNSSPEV